MMNSRTTGGIAALYAGCAYIFGFAVLAFLLSPEQAAAWTKAQKLEFLIANQTLLSVWNSVIYTLFGIVLVFLTIALDARISQAQSIGRGAAKVLGFIWAGLLIASGMIANVGMQKVITLYPSEPEFAMSLWQTLGAIQDGLGGGVEVIGGLWVLMISVIALRSKALPNTLNYIGLLVGIAGCITIVPGLSEAGAVFGLGQILWFLWLSLVLFKHDTARS
ncbi:hypothetical protein [Alteromonas ponticola]|uniref:DUF4386 family protein n=1 Tax=Alteromonas ponticola TaxID=2720613 RepID=A0ABX1QYD2_9ALTE|nr:hypothetical protein [Alteromonas ponticola]NMH59250.1 hypothetical protein [Alteromonas ponticola]